jgi:drug/metabolite transporter superfamily protein YnfA
VRIPALDELHHFLVSEIPDIDPHAQLLRIASATGSTASILSDAMDGPAPAQLYALAIGLVLVALGVVGFFYEASFETGGGLSRDAVLGVLDVNGWHNLVHIVSGVFGLLVATSYPGARVYALAFGGIYLLVSLLGFLAGDGGVVLGLLPVSTEDNVLHLLVGVAGVGAGISTPADPAPSTALPA